LGHIHSDAVKDFDRHHEWLHPGLWAVSALAVVALAALAFRRKSGA